MSEHIRLFKDWMVASGKTPNTANSYYAGVNAISKHAGRDLFDVDDLAELAQLCQRYSPEGEFADIGAGLSGAARNGLYQWLAYLRQLGGPSALAEAHQQWGAFLARWPAAQLQDLTLADYYGAPGDDSFYSWLRDHTAALGEFKEGILSAGVRLRVGNTSTEAGLGMQSDGRHIWYANLGDSAQAAFDQLKRELLMIVAAVQRGDVSPIASAKVPAALAWKVAFLYQDQNQPVVLPVYTDRRLKWLAGPDAPGSMQALQQRLMSRRGEQDVLAFAAELARQAMQAQAITDQQESLRMAKHPVALNQILYGPPGTGKTYSTINQALAILAPDFLDEQGGEGEDARRRLKAEFDRFVQEERVRFVTFHQSFSYEDFVEGLRAESDPETGQVSYPIESGVFKRICDDARTRPATDLGVRANPAIWKISIAGTGASPTKSYCLAHGEARIGWGETGDLRADVQQNPYYQALGNGDKGTLSYFAEQMAVGDILLCIQSAELIGSIGVVTSDYRYEARVPAGVTADFQHVRAVRWLYRDINLSVLPLNDERQFTLKTVYAMNRFTWADLLGYLQQQGIQPVAPVVATAAADEPYVLIIDEINRGNVSRIFGELITLIEPSKREGADEALSLKLPYSKRPFSVPRNVYLIGTMNTADRSLAGLDIALRRRFIFHEMPPRPALLDDVEVGGVNIGQLLRVMNERIEVLLDRDHCLGHAYFMPLKREPSLRLLESTFRNQILPLLQEYFFEDWERIGWVLNDHRAADEASRFIRRPQRERELATLFGDDVATRLNDQRWVLNDAALGSLASYQNILG